ncbi:MAG TPA: DinB family protein [Mucilaginibacter sp.]|nr:DinB family protein [Mucilaginibacter sp.]
MLEELLSSQYGEVKGARDVLFTYCKKIKPEELYQPLSEFNNSSIADLLIHNVNTYISWINNFGLSQDWSFYKTADVKSLREIIALFDLVNLFMVEFVEKYQNSFLVPITALIKHRGFSKTLAPMHLYTHVITHEFHHKGQILTMSRLLGYTPVDTDIIRT